MEAIKKIKMDILDNQKAPVVYAVQCEANTRILKISLYSGGVEWPVPDGVAVSVAYRKADRTSGWYDKLPDGSAACSVAGNVVTAIMAPQVLTAAGRCHVVIVLQDPATLNQLATFPLRIEVAPNPAAGKGISNDYYNYGTMATINQVIEEILAEVESHQQYRGNVVELGYTSFADCKHPGYYSYTAEDIATLTDAPEGLTSGGIITVESSAASNVVFQTIKTASGQEWFRYSNRSFVKIVSGLDADRQLCYWGKVLWQGETFAACEKSGYYSFAAYDIANITDAPEGLTSGGILEVRGNAAGGTIFQTILCANGDEWFRYGANPFAKVLRDQSEIDNLYTAMGIVRPGKLIQGAPTKTGALNKNTKLSICAEKPVYFGAGESHNVLLDDGWCFTVTEFDDPDCSTTGAEYYDKSTSSTYTPQKDYGWVRFNKLGDDGEYVEIAPADFDGSVVFQRSDRSGGGSDIRSDVPESIGVLNALLNARQCSQIRYTPVAALPTQKYADGFPAGTEVTGLPYSSTRLEQLFVPNNVSLYTFMSALQNPNSLLYSVKLDEDYGVDNARTYYGIVCSILAEYALGIKPGYTTALWDKIPGMELIEDQSAYGLRLGDVLWRSGHVLLVTDIKRYGDGTIHSIEVTEGASGRDGTIDVISYALAEFSAKFVSGDTAYKFYRYRYIHKAKHAPTAIVPVGGETFDAVATYNTTLMGRLGDRFNVRAGENVVLDVLDQAAYTQYKVVKDGVALTTADIPASGVITLTGLAYGSYGVCLTDGTTDSASIDFIAVDAPAPTVTATGNANEYKLDFASANATPAWVMWFVDGSKKAIATQIDELTGDETSITTVLQKTSGYVRIALETEYGIILSQSAVGEYTGAPVEDEYPRDAEHYYATLSDAISDINGGIVSKAGNGRAVKVFTAHTGVLTVVLLEDVSESATISVAKSLDIAINGHVLRLTGADTLLQFAADTDCTVWGGGGRIIKDGVVSDSNVFFVRADGVRLRFVDCNVQMSGAGAEAMLAIRGGGDLLELDGGSVSVDNAGAGGAWAVQGGNGEALLRRCDLRAACIGTKTGNALYDAIVLYTRAKVTAEHCHMVASSQQGYAIAAECRDGTDATLRDTAIEAITHTDGANAHARGVYNNIGAVLRIEGGKILADAPGDGASEDCSVGISNLGTAHLSKAEISATHSGISNFGELYVDGGKYTGYSHGGIYFAHGAEGAAYINDATLRDGNYEGIFTDIFAGDTVMPLGGFYVGGGAEANHSDITVYLDGCTIDTVYRAFVLRNSSGEANNTVNLSNCTIVDPANHPMRIDTETMRVNIGLGCNFTPDNAVADDDGEDASAWAHLTGELYRRKHGDAVCSGRDFEVLAHISAVEKFEMIQAIEVAETGKNQIVLAHEMAAFRLCVEIPAGAANSTVYADVYTLEGEQAASCYIGNGINSAGARCFKIMGDTDHGLSDVRFTPAAASELTGVNIQTQPKTVQTRGYNRIVLTASSTDFPAGTTITLWGLE